MSELHFVGILTLVFLMAYTSVAVPMNFMNSILIFKELSPELRQNCTKELINWCKQNEPSAQQIKKSSILIDYLDVLTNSKVMCVISSDGTDCIKNMLPWFHCYPDGNITYKNALLRDSTVLVDDDICETKETAVKLDHQLGFDEEELETEVGNYLKDVYDLYKQLSLMRNMIDDVKKRVNNISPGIFNSNAIIEGITSLDNLIKMLVQSENTIQTTSPSTSTKLAQSQILDENKTTVKPNKDESPANVNKNENTVKNNENKSTVRSDESEPAANIKKSENTVKNKENEATVRPDESETTATVNKNKNTVENNENEATVRSDESENAVNAKKSENTVENEENKATVRPDESKTTAKVNKNENTVENNENEATVRSDGSDTAANVKKGEATVSPDKSKTTANANKT